MIYRAIGAMAGAAMIFGAAGAAMAQEGGGVLVLDPVTVSGEIIERSRLRTGTSVEVLDSEELDKRPAVNNVRDAMEDAVNVTVPFGTGKAPSIRGVDGTGPAENANAFFAGSRPRLGLNIDGRPAGYNEIVFGNASLWDIGSVEILRGPQSTLVGRNAIAGTVIVKSNDPTFDYGAAVESSGGNLDWHRFSGMANLPIVDEVLAVRFAADWQSSVSSIDYDPFPNVDDPGEIRSLNVRGKLLAYPDLGEASTLRVTVSHNSHEAPNGEIVVRPFSDRRSNFPLQPVHEPTTTSVSGEFDVDLNDAWRLEMNASFSDFHFSRTAVPNTSNATIDTLEFTLDPRVRYSGAGGFEVLVGAHVFVADQDEYIEVVADQNFQDNTQTYAVYGEAIIPIVETLDLSVGGRYEIERRRRVGGDAAGAIVDVDSDRTFQAFLPRVGVNWQPTDEQSYGIQVSRGYNSGGGGVTFGFPNPFPIIHYEFDEETVWSFEIYGRQDLWDGRVSLTQNAFYARYSDMQIPFDPTPENTQDELFIVANAEEVVTYGAELGGTINLTNGLSLFGNVGLLQTEILEFPGSGVEGNRLLIAPNVTASAGVSWRYDGWAAAFSGRYTDGYFSSIQNRPRGETDPYFVADANLSYSFGNFTLFGEVSNIFDNEAVISINPGTTPAADNAVLLQPRTFRIGGSLRF